MNLIKKFFQKVKNVMFYNDPSKIQHELQKEFHIKNKEAKIERFYIHKQGKYTPVEIRDRLRHDRYIVRVDTGDYSRDKGIANLILSLILDDDPKRWKHYE